MLTPKHFLTDSSREVVAANRSSVLRMGQNYIFKGLQRRKGYNVMKFCENCGKQLVNEAVSCPHCGWELSKNEKDINFNAYKTSCTNESAKGFNLHIISIIAGVLGAIIGFWFPIFGIMVAFIGIVFSIIGKVFQTTYKFFAVGLLVSIGGIVASIASWILGTILFLMM